MKSIENLKKITLFKELGEEALARFADIMQELSLSDGDTIFTEGDIGDALYVIIDGKVEIRKCIDPESGREKVLATLRAGDFFGDMSLYSGERRSASAYAVNESTLMRIGSSDYLTLTQTDTAIASKLSYAIIKILGSRLRTTSRELVVLFETGKLAGSVTNPDELCHNILNRVADLMQAEAGVLVLFDELSNSIDVKAYKGLMPYKAGKPLNSGDNKGIIGRVFDSGEPIIARSIEDDPEISDTFKPVEGIKSVLCVPLSSQTGTGTIGALLLCDTTENSYGDSEINLLMGVSRQIATALENARLNFEIRARQDYKRIYIQPNF